MQARTVLMILRTIDGQDLVDLSEAVAAPDNGAIAPHPLGISPTQPEVLGFRQDTEGGGHTGAVGKALWKALSAQADIAHELAAAVAQKAPIFLNDRSAAAQALPWEILCNDQGVFLALDEGLRLARLASGTQASSSLKRIFDRPLRMLAVLAAAGGEAGETSEREWQSLESALAKTPIDLDWQLAVLGCDDVVRQAIEAKGDPRITFELLTSVDAILDTVESFQPHVLHLFCHGFHEPAPRLELATRSDQELGEPSGSLILELPDFRRLLQRNADIWLVLLNCCLGAAPGGESQALARQMVLEGYPAVIGMQEPIDRHDAHLFSEVFYTSFLRFLGKVAKKPPPIAIDWPALLVEPRQKLCRLHQPALSKASNTKAWALPVLYVGRQPFELADVITPLDPVQAAELQAQIEELTRIRADLAAKPGFPPTLLGDIDNRIENLRQQLVGD